MANKDLVDAIKRNLDSLDGEGFEVLLVSGGRAQPWQNQTPEEIKNFIEDTLDMLRKTIDEELLITIPFNLLNSINGSMNNFFNQYNQIKNTQPEQMQNQHHNPLNQLQAANQQLRTSGVYAISMLGPDIEVKRGQIEEQLAQVSQANADIIKLQSQIKSLINPAAADSLSSAFDTRRGKISTQKWIWAIIVACSVGLAMYATYDITDSIGELVKEMSNGKDENGKTKAEVDPNDIPLIWFMRLLLLAPSYFLVFFSFKQYVRERMLEENYAHKSAIAQTLPSYSELVTDTRVRDEITSSATKVAFELPKTEEEKSNSSIVSQRSVNELSSRIDKILKLDIGGKT